MKIIHELIKIIEKMDQENFENQKPELLKLARMSALSLGDEDKQLTSKGVEELYNLWLMPFKQDQEFIDEIESMMSKLTNVFLDAYDTLTNGMVERGYCKDAIELSTFVLRSIGGKARGLNLIVGRNQKSFEYNNSNEYLTDLRTEMAKQLCEQTCESLYVLALIINGLVYSIKENLDETSRHLAGTILSMTAMDGRKIEELEQDEILGKYFNKQYPKELRVRIYLWDKLTVELRNEYSIDEILKD